MASAFSHIAVPAILYASFKSDKVNFRLFVLAAVCSVFPDIDVIGFKFGILMVRNGVIGVLRIRWSLPYAWLPCQPLFIRSSSLNLGLYFGFVSCASHAFLDAMTNGGLGVALFWPFSSGWIFFPFRPIQVSPIGVGSFFTEWGLRVIVSELVWVLILALIIGTLGAIIRRTYGKKWVLT